MKDVPANATEAVERFGVKRASLATILPTVAFPALGAYAGRRFLHVNQDLGGMLGGITGGVAGQEIRELLEQRQQAQQQQSNMPMGAPYAIDPTMQDIPPWALQGASMLRPSLKLSALLTHPHGTLASKGA